MGTTKNELLQLQLGSREIEHLFNCFKLKIEKCITPCQTLGDFMTEIQVRLQDEAQTSSREKYDPFDNQSSMVFENCDLKDLGFTLIILLLTEFPECKTLLLTNNQIRILNYLYLLEESDEGETISGTECAM